MSNARSEHRLRDRSYSPPSMRQSSSRDSRQAGSYDRHSRDRYGRDSRSRSRSPDRHRSRHRSPLPPQPSFGDRRGYSGSSRGGGRGGRPDPEYLAQRRAKREMTKFSIWAPSPTASEDEEDCIEEERIIAKMRGRYDEPKRDSQVSSGDEFASASASDFASDTDSCQGYSDSDGGNSKRSKYRKSSKSSSRKSESKSKGPSSHKGYDSGSRRKSRSRRKHYSDYSDSEYSDYVSDDRHRSSSSRHSRSHGKRHDRDDRD
ncbi:hypothetical protein GGI12_006366, partial [Dipsacomyces acuminosporus]